MWSAKFKSDLIVSYLWHELIGYSLVVLKANLACSQGPLQKEPKRQLCKLCLDKCTDGLVGEGKDLLTLLFPLIILMGGHIWDTLITGKTYVQHRTCNEKQCTAPVRRFPCIWRPAGTQRTPGEGVCSGSFGFHPHQSVFVLCSESDHKSEGLHQWTTAETAKTLWLKRRELENDKSMTSILVCSKMKKRSSSV